MQRGRPLLGSNAGAKVLKYFIVNNSRFLKGYHNRVYFYSSGTILARVGIKLKRYMESLDDPTAQMPDDSNSEDPEECEEEDDNAAVPAEVLIRKVCCT